MFHTVSFGANTVKWGPQRQLAGRRFGDCSHPTGLIHTKAVMLNINQICAVSPEIVSLIVKSNTCSTQIKINLLVTMNADPPQKHMFPRSFAHLLGLLTSN